MRFYRIFVLLAFLFCSFSFLASSKTDAALVYPKIDLDKSIPMIKDAINNAYNTDLLIPNQFELANKILKDNNA